MSNAQILSSLRTARFVASMVLLGVICAGLLASVTGAQDSELWRLVGGALVGGATTFAKFMHWL